MSHLFNLEAWMVGALWVLVLAYALCVTTDAERATRWIERAVFLLTAALTTYLLNALFFGLTAKDLLNNPLLYPVYDWYRFG